MLRDMLYFPKKLLLWRKQLLQEQAAVGLQGSASPLTHSVILREFVTVLEEPSCKRPSGAISTCSC